MSSQHGTSSAYTHAADLRFPEHCICCSAAPFTTVRITARRGIDLLFVAAWDMVNIPVPVCERCARQRRVAGIAMWTLVPLFLLVVGFLAASLAIDGDHRIVALTLFGTLLLVSVAVRLRGDVVVNWLSLGARIDYLSGEGIPLRVSFRQAEAFVAWLKVNPCAVPSRTLLSREAIMTENTSPEPVTFSRQLPVITLIVCLIILGLHHWYAVTHHRVYAVAVLLFSALGGLAMGGTLSPSVFFAAGAYGKQLPVSTKVIAVLCGVAGFAIGMIGLIKLY